MLCKSVRLMASVGLAALFSLAAPSPALAQGYLGTNLRPFAVLAGSTVTCTGPSTVTGDLGVSPGSAVIGFPVPCTVVGTTHAADATAALAQLDLTTAFTTLGPTLPCTLDLTGTDLGGLTLTPGVYCFSTSAQLTGPLTLNALGDPNAVWVFRTGSTLTTASGSSVVFSGGIGNACAVQWRVGTSATLGTTTSFAGNILAQSSITLNTGATLAGRALARTGAVTLDGNNITTFAACGAGAGPTGAPPPFPLAPTVTKAFSPASITVGGVSRLTITVSNPNAALISLIAAFTDTLPTGVLVAATPNLTTTCGGTVTAPGGGSTVTLATGSTIPSGSCTIGVDVTAAAAGSFVNTIPAGALQTSSGNNAAPATAPLVVVTAVPTLPQAFALFLALGLAGVGYLRLRQRARAE